MSYIFDRLDKQIIKKFPYALLLSFFIYAPISHFNIKYTANISIIVFTVSMIVFLFSTIYFDIKVGNAVENSLPYNNLQNLTKKINEIIEGQSSLLDDLKGSENWSFIVSGILGGASFILILILAFFTIIYYFKIGLLLTIPIVVILIVYAYQDLAKTNLFEEYQTKEKVEALYTQNILQTYIVDNSFKSLHRKSIDVLLKLTALLLGPICSFKVSALGTETFLVYFNDKIEQLIKEMTIKDQENSQVKKKKISFKEVKDFGLSVEEFFMADRKGENISLMTTQSPKELFPYLFDPSYTYASKDKKTWMALDIIAYNGYENKIQGILFMHKFKFKTIKKSNSDIKPALLFILLGNQEYIQYIKTTIEIITVKFPMELISSAKND
ncbi:MAG: hypothetical protein ACP5U0_08390 [Caldisphaera sp.]